MERAAAALRAAPGAAGRGVSLGVANALAWALTQAEACATPSELGSFGELRTSLWDGKDFWERIPPIPKIPRIPVQIMATALRAAAGSGDGRVKGPHAERWLISGLFFVIMYVPNIEDWYILNPTVTICIGNTVSSDVAQVTLKATTNN